MFPNLFSNEVFTCSPCNSSLHGKAIRLRNSPTVSDFKEYICKRYVRGILAFKYLIITCASISSLWPSDAIWRYKSGST